MLARAIIRTVWLLKREPGRGAAAGWAFALGGAGGVSRAMACAVAHVATQCSCAAAQSVPMANRAVNRSFM
jgi:hypothetical protein